MKTYRQTPLFLLSALLLLSGGIASGQDFLTGTVKNSTGEPIPGAILVVPGTEVYATADSTGAFRIRTPQTLPLVLRISFIGYKAKELRFSQLPQAPLDIFLEESTLLAEIVITARRRSEAAQEVPIPISVLGGALVEETGSFNVNRVKELVPSVQLYTSNPRNTTLNIRGMGSTFGLTNDGIDPGVGFYVDGVYYARPAATTLDFIDVERIEVLRGPQGTLFGKNTTAGAFNVITRKPSFTAGGNAELSYGNYGHIQAKSSVTGPLGKKFAGRLSFSGTQRDGVIYNVTSQQHVNDVNNLGARAQLLFTPSARTSINLAADFSRQRPNGFAHVVAGVVPTLRPEYRQFEQIIADLNYELPSREPFDRLVDHNTYARSNNDLGGVSLNIDAEIGPGTLTSTTAWRYWNWDPSSDRDFTSLPLLTLSQAPSRHQQWSQEVRYAGNFSSRLSGVAGIYVIGQDLKSDPYHTEESGSARWRFARNSDSPLWQTPGLFDGYGIRTRSRLTTFSGAVFAQVDWEFIDKFHVLPGIRLNYDKKEVDFDRRTYGGLDTDDPELIALKNAVYAGQAFTADVDDNNLSGQLTLAFRPRSGLNAYATFATSYKPVGINLGGLPRSGGQPMLELAQIKPEYVTHYEAGIKTTPGLRSTLNLTIYNTDIRDFQAQVQTPDPGVNRGYLANAEKVRVRGAELDGSIQFSDHSFLYGGVAYADGEYVSFTNAPVPLEETGAPEAFKDISGGELPGISKWTVSLGGELERPASFFGRDGSLFFAADGYFRSSFSSSPSPSRYLVIDGYALLNARAGFRAFSGASIYVWSRNLLDQDYFEQLLPVSGGAGNYAGVLGDPRTFGITVGYAF